MNVSFVTFIVAESKLSDPALNLISPKREIKILMKLVYLRVVKCNFRKQKANLLTIVEPKGAKCCLKNQEIKFVV